MRMPQQQPASFRENEPDPSKQDRPELVTPKVAETSNENAFRPFMRTAGMPS